MRRKESAIEELLRVMARLRSPTGCPWDREQDHLSLRWHAVEEVYELIDAIEAGDDHEMEEELGDLLFQVVFHCQLARERRAFDFEKVTRHIADKLIRVAARREAAQEGAARQAGDAETAAQACADARAPGTGVVRFGSLRAEPRLVSRGVAARRDSQAGAGLAAGGVRARPRASGECAARESVLIRISRCPI